MRKGLLWWVFQPYKWLFVIPFAVMNTIVMGSMSAGLAIVFGERIGSLGGVFWAKLIGWISFLRIQIIGRENVDATQSYIIIANHQSAYDIIAIYGWLGIDFKWVMKQELRKVPFLGYACYKLGHIYIDRKNSPDAMKTLQEAKHRLVNGTSVLFFPEGTRTQTSKLKPFKKGAFKMAVDLGLPILPVTLKGLDNIMPTQTVDLMPGKAEIIFHSPIPTDNISEHDIDALIEQCSKVMATPLKLNK